MAVFAPPEVHLDGHRRPGGGPRSLSRAVALVLAATLAVAPGACAAPPHAGSATDKAGSEAALAVTGAVTPGKVLAATVDGDGQPDIDTGAGAGAAAGTEGEDADARPSAEALGQYLAGRAAQYASDVEAAAAHYGAALAADPDNPMLMRRAYFYLAAAGRFDEAVGVARRAVDAMPGDDFAPLLLATDAMRRDDPAAAVDLLSALEPRGLNGLTRPLLLSWARVAAGDTSGGLETLDEADTLSSARRLLDLHGALVALVVGDRDQAARRLDAHLAEGPPDNARPLELIAFILARLDRVEQARQVVADYVAAGPAPLAVDALAESLETGGAAALPDLIGTPTEGYAEALYHAGLVVNQGRASETGIVLMRLALAVRPDFGRAALAIAESLRRMERFEAANAVLTGIDTTDAPALDYVVQLYTAENLEQLDRIDDALSRYEALATDHPTEVEPLVDKGDLLRREERYEEAAAAYSRALERVEDDGPVLWPVLYRRGIARERAGQWPGAEADFLRALDLEPDQPEVLNYLGYSWLDRGENIERAVDMIRTAVRRRPNDGYIVDSLGWGYYLLGRYEEAVTELERAVELRPQDWTINDHLGDAYWRVDRRVEARFQWERALSLEPEDDAVETIRRKLDGGLPPADNGGPSSAARPGDPRNAGGDR